MDHIEKKIPGEAEFTVRIHKGYSIAKHEEVTRYCVDLPHQCDDWTITDEESREDAIAAMERFLAEGQAALEKLRTIGEREPIATPSGTGWPEQ